MDLALEDGRTVDQFFCNMDLATRPPSVRKKINLFGQKSMDLLQPPTDKNQIFDS
jgi:hypothetical protein